MIICTQRALKKEKQKYEKILKHMIFISRSEHTTSARHLWTTFISISKRKKIKRVLGEMTKTRTQKSNPAAPIGNEHAAC